MENVIHYLALDLTGPDMCPMIEVQRGDSARSLVIALTQGGRPYWIDEGLTAALYGKKPDGNPLFNACTIEKNRIRYDFTPQTVNVAGAFDCEIWLVAGDKRELTTPRFSIAVDERMRTDDVIPESAPEYTAITEMVAAGTAMIGELREALAGLEGVEEILTQARAAAEAASDSEAAARGHAKTAADGAANAQTLAGQAYSAAQQSNKYALEAQGHREAAEAAAKEAKEAAANLPQGGGNGSGNAPLSAEEKTLILTLFRNAAYVSDNMGDTLTQLETLWGGGGEEPENPDVPEIPDEPDIPVVPDEPEKTLTGISATYSGGDVAAGTAVSALTGVVVTAHYSDGTSEAVTGYTLTGEIAEGENAVTVSYEGKTTTITVAGVTSGEVEPTDNRYAYTIDNPGTLCDTSGGLTGNNLYNTTGYIDVAADTEYMTVAVNVPISENKTPVITNAQWFNTEEFISRTDAIVTVPVGGTKAVGRHKIPSGATKFRISVQTNASKFLLYKGTVSVDDAEF